jgi:CBS domain-containing protein
VPDSAHGNDAEREEAIGMTNTVRDVMTTPVVTVRPDTPFKQVVARVRAVGTVPVTDDSGLVRGIVCERDLLLDPQAFRVTVRDGIVTLSGRPESDQAGRLLAATVRRVEGVVSLRDQMLYSAGDTTERAALSRLSRAAAALALAFR